MRLAAFDISSKLGWAAWDGAAQHPTIDTKTLVGFGYGEDDMLEFYRQWLGSWLQAYRPEVLLIEGWIVASHGDQTTAAKLIMLSGFTRWCCKMAKVRSLLVPAATWRKEIYGSARGKSAEFKTKARDRARQNRWLTVHGDVPDDNACEAGLILEYAAIKIAGVMPPWRLVANNKNGGQLV